MLEKSDWDQAAKRLLNNIENETRELADSPYEAPVSYYCDQERWQREIDVIFKRLPLILAMSCELAEPNSYKAMQPLGIPLLLTRSDDGKVRGFLNKCRHRAAVLTGDAEKCGVAKRFSCPYHAWTFDNKGNLTGLPGQTEFGDIPPSYRHLIEISVDERAGFIWGILTPGLPIDIEDHLGDMLPMLEKAGIDKFHFIGEKFQEGSNWKLAFDGYIESYHFNTLHRDTFGKHMLHDFAAFDEAKAHTRYMVPTLKLINLRDLPESEWDASGEIMYAFNIFPNTNMTILANQNPDLRMLHVSQLWPGKGPGHSITRHVSSTPQLMTGEKREGVEKLFAYNCGVIANEDYWVVNGQQSGLEAMADEKVIYGRMERIVQTIEREVNAVVDASYQSEKSEEAARSEMAYQD
jgi:phenylpropionate dioxygenase-like ring-hydroxylating dioxygenase large terminal subunit